MCALFDKSSSRDDDWPTEEEYAARRKLEPQSQPAPHPSETNIFAEKAIRALSSGAEPDEIATAYAALLNAFPDHDLPADVQLNMARFLARQNFRPLGIAAYQKILHDEKATSETRAEARLISAWLLGKHPATLAEAQALLDELRQTPEGAGVESKAAALENHLSTAFQSIYPQTPCGEPGSRPEGPCCLLAQFQMKYSVPEISRIICQASGLSPIDVKIALARGHGVLARNAPPEQAEEAALAIRDAGLPVVVAPEENCPQIPMAETVEDVRDIGDGRLEFALETGSAEIEIPQLKLAHFGMLSSVSVETSHLQSRTIPGLSKTFTRSERRQTQFTGMCDLHLLDARRRLRLSEGKTAVETLMKPGPEDARPSFLTFVKRVLRGTSQLRGARNGSLEALYSGAVIPATHEALRDFESEAEWIYWLANNNALGD